MCRSNFLETTPRSRCWNNLLVHFNEDLIQTTIIPIYISHSSSDFWINEFNVSVLRLLDKWIQCNYVSVLPINICYSIFDSRDVIWFTCDKLLCWRTLLYTNTQSYTQLHNKEFNELLAWNINYVQMRTTGKRLGVIQIRQSTTKDTYLHELKVPTSSMYKFSYKSQFRNIQLIDSSSYGEPSGIWNR